MNMCPDQTTGAAPNIYTGWPPHTLELTTYEQQSAALTESWEHERRDPGVPDPGGNHIYSLRILWTDRARGMGYGIGDDICNKRIRWYRFGPEAAWRELGRARMELFGHDGSLYSA